MSVDVFGQFCRLLATVVSTSITDGRAIRDLSLLADGCDPKRITDEIVQCIHLTVPHSRLPVFYLIDSLVRGHRHQQFRPLLATHVPGAFASTFEAAADDLRYVIRRFQERRLMKLFV